MSSSVEALMNDADFADLEFDALEPSIKNIIEQESLRWIFVGGKGGVGKTTTSCSLAVQLAQHRKNVLLISTDPAHNISDAFGQQFSKEATKVNGFDNLFCMEIDPTVEMGDVDMPEEQKSFLTSIASSIPGIDEAMSFAELLKQVQTLSYDCVVFDTAPTGHTLRLLSFPSVLDKALNKLVQLKDRFAGVFGQMQALMGGAAGGMDMDAMLSKLETTKATIAKIQEQFADPELTTFVCVCIPEFLSLYETERLIQQLAQFGIDSHNIVVNQVLFPYAGACRKYLARSRMQNKYVEQIKALYQDFHIALLPLLDDEVRGVPRLRKFGGLLVEPYQPPEFQPDDCDSARIQDLSQQIAELRRRVQELEQQQQH
ncbi:MAG: hypothetical protein MHM6MM_006162 [Cercozoa sp. M6MM]